MANNEKLTFTELVKLAPADLFGYAKDTIKLKKAVATATDKFKENLKFSAKVVAAMKRYYTEQVNARNIPGDTAFKDYFEQNAGGTVPGRIEALSALFNSLVETGLLKEEHYDCAAVDWLEKANAIVADARKKHGDKWKSCDDVLDVINALSKPGDALKVLKDIRKRQKDEAAIAEGKAAAGEPAETKTRESTPLTLEVAVAFITASFGAAGNATKARQLELCAALYEMNDAWEQNDLTVNRKDELDAQIRKAQALGVDPTIEIITEHQAVAA